MNENEMKKTSGLAQLFETLVALLKRLFGGSRSNTNTERSTRSCNNRN